MKTHEHSWDRGFTLTEMLITLILASIVTFGIFRVFTATNQSYRRGTESIDGQQNARAALDWLSKELRSAKGFNLIGADQVTFLSDRTTRNQMRTFRLDTTDQDNDGDTSELLLIRNPDDDGTPGVFMDEIAVGVDSLSFTYMDSDGNVTGSRAAVKVVEVAIFATGNQMRDRDEADAHGVRQVGMSTLVTCRNLGKSVPTLGDVTPPDPPTGINASMGCGVATVNWAANTETDLAGYFLYYSQGSGGPPYDGVDALQGPAPIFVGNVTSYTLTGLDLSSTYYFNLRAVDSADNMSALGGEVSGAPTDATAPSTPANLVGRVVGNDEIELNWSASPEWDIKGYRIQWYDDTDFTNVRMDSTLGTSLTLSNLVQDAVHYCSILAEDNCGNQSAWSSEITITMVPCDQDVTFPAIPANFNVTPGDEFVKLTWDLVPDTDVVGYQVYFTGGGQSYGSTLLVGNVDSYSVYGLENGESYNFQVAALDGCGHLGGYSASEAGTPVACGNNTTAPDPILNLAAVDLGIGDQVKLSWTQSPDGDVLGYRVFWGTAPGSYSYSTDVGNNIFFTVAGLATSTKYYFTVTAYDICGNESLYATEVAEIPTWGCACPPTVSTQTISNYDILQGVVAWNVTAMACSSVTLDQVEFWVDGVTQYVDYTSPYEFGDFAAGWYTQFETNGPHTLVSKAVDENGCETADTLNVFVDNTGVGVSCVGIEDGDYAVVAGAANEVLSMPVTNLSSIDTYDLNQLLFTWDDPNLALYAITFDGMLVWYSSDSPGSASGDSLPLMTSQSIYPEDQFTMDLYFTDLAGNYPPLVDLSLVNYEVTFLGGPIVECGPYALTVSVDCDVIPTISSVNSSRPYDVWGTPALDDAYYTDRTYWLTYLPEELEDSVLLRTPNDDKNTGDSHQLVVDVDHDVTVWIAYDPRGTPPTWIRDNYTDTGLSVGVTDSGTPTLDLWSKEFPQGAITFSGNKASGWGGGIGTNYIIFFVCR